MKGYTLEEASGFSADVERIARHLDRTIGDPLKTDEILREIRASVTGLTEFPNRFAARPELGSGIRLCVVRQKGVVLYRVDERAKVVLVLRAFYGGEDYDALFGGD